MQESINKQKTWFASIFLVYLLSDHSIILRKCTPGLQGCKIAYKGAGYFFTPPKWVTSPIWGSPPSFKQALNLTTNGEHVKTGF